MLSIALMKINTTKVHVKLHKYKYMYMYMYAMCSSDLCTVKTHRILSYMWLVNLRPIILRICGKLWHMHTGGYQALFLVPPKEPEDEAILSVMCTCMIIIIILMSEDTSRRHSNHTQICRRCCHSHKVSRAYS